MSEKKKAVITILGLSDFEAEYSSTVDAIKLKTSHYLNMFDLLCQNIPEEYEVVPFYTKEAEEKQKRTFEKYEDKIRKYDDDCSIDENNFESILKQFNNIIDKYDKVIIDVTNGLRHIPILVTINMIMQNIKQVDKIENIIFGKMKEDSRITRNKFSVYEIIDLKEYLDLANLSYILTNFKDNYTISSNIKISTIKYKSLINSMNQFSRDIMALSMYNLFQNTYPALDKIIEEIKDDFILGKDLEKLQEELEIFKLENRKRYRLYFDLAKNLNKKNYLLQAVALIAEAKGFYLKTSMKNIDNKTKKYFNKIEKQITEIAKKEDELTYDEQNYNYYQLNKECKSIYSTSADKLYNGDNPKYKTFKLLKDKNIIKKIKQKITFDKKFKEFLWRDLRNQLVHANTEKEIENVKNKISADINEFQQFCIEKNILNYK